MKNTVTILLYISLLAPCIMKGQKFYSKNLEQCSDPKFLDQCSEMLPKNDYVYLSSKDFSTDETGSIEFSITLKRNVLYVVNICEGVGKSLMSLSIWDNSNKEVATSFNKKTKRNDRIIYFQPSSSGKYYITSNFDKKISENCCLIMFGMIRKNKEKYMN